MSVFRQFKGPSNGSTFAGVPRIRTVDPLAPIAGVDLLTYARVVKGAVVGELRADAIVAWAESLGVTSEAWQQAGREWPRRMRGNQRLAEQYGTIYGQVAA